MHWIDSKWAKIIGWFSTISSFLLAIYQMISLNWVMEHLSILVPLLSFLTFSIFLLVHYYRRKKKYYESKLGDLENSIAELKKDKEKQEKNIGENKKDVERLDHHVGRNWKHIKDISSSLNEILEENGKEKLDF